MSHVTLFALGFNPSSILMYYGGNLAHHEHLGQEALRTRLRVPYLRPQPALRASAQRFCTMETIVNQPTTPQNADSTWSNVNLCYHEALGILET